jgi:hypothetical protein
MVAGDALQRRFAARGRFKRARRHYWRRGGLSGEEVGARASAVVGSVKRARALQRQRSPYGFTILWFCGFVLLRFRAYTIRLKVLTSATEAI